MLRFLVLGSDCNYLTSNYYFDLPIAFIAHVGSGEASFEGV